MERIPARAGTIRLLTLAILLAAGNACAETPSPEPSPQSTSDSPRQEAAMTVLARATGPISLTDRPVSVTLEAVEGTPRRISSADVRLIVRDLHTDAPPGVLFQVYLGALPEADDDAADTAGDPAGERLLGTFNFFGALPAASGDADDAPAPDRFHSFTLPGDSPVSLPLTITLVPREPPDLAASPTVGSIELVRASR